jgi:hypothetical protein
LAILLIPLASASENVNAATKDNKLSKSYHFATHNRTLLAQAYGKNMTVAEYMEKVYPESLQKLPEDVVEQLKVKPKVWSNEKNIEPGVQVARANISSKLKGTVTPKDWINHGYYTAWCSSYTTTDVQNKIGFVSYSQMTYPSSTTTIPGMWVDSTLYEDDLPIDNQVDYEINTNRAFASSYDSLDYYQHEYWVLGEHLLVWPGLSYPQGSWVTTVSPVVTLPVY